MKKLFTFFLLSFPFVFFSQTYSGSGGQIINNGGQETGFNLNVTTLNPSIIDSIFGLEEVMIDVIHPEVKELEIYLASPSGTTIHLTGALSCKGANFNNTCFKNGMPTSVTIGNAPYTGTYNAVGNIGRFNSKKSGLGTWRLYVKDFVAGPNTGTVVNWSLKFSNSPAKPVLLNSSNLPLVFLTTPNNQNLSSTSTLITVGIVNNGSARNYITDPKNNFNGKAMCHVRGSSSKMFEKNNLKLELTDASGLLETPASLLGMPAESDWILTASYSDKTLMRNALTQQLFQKMGHYSPRYKFVELFINNEYYGVYILMEQIKRGTNRVKIDKTAPGDNQWPYITGGYIFQINRTDDAGWYSLKPGISSNQSKFYYQYNYPRDIEITPQQKNYIKTVVDSFETVLSSPTFTDPAKGYKKFINDDDFIDFLIINELSKNVDAYRLSSYIYKDNVMDGGKMHIGPVWDFDLAWHNCNFGNTASEAGWQFTQSNSAYPIPTWWTQLMQDPNFKNKLYCRYHSLRQNALKDSEIFKFIDETESLLGESQKRNFKQFPILGSYVYPNPQSQVGANYLTEISDLKSWVSKRSAWLDNNVPGFCNSIGLNEIPFSGNNFSVYPNPFSDILNVEFIMSKTEKVKIDVINIIGQNVLSVKDEDKSKGECSESVDLNGLIPGSYLLRLEIDGQVSFKKVLKL